MVTYTVQMCEVRLLNSRGAGREAHFLLLFCFWAMLILQCSEFALQGPSRWFLENHTWRQRSESGHWHERQALYLPHYRSRPRTLKNEPSKILTSTNLVVNTKLGAAKR